MGEYIQEVGHNNFIIFKCNNCKHEFELGVIDLERHTIFCPNCNKEWDVDPETYLQEVEDDDG